MLVEPDTVALGAAIDFSGVVFQQLVMNHWHLAAAALAIAGAQSRPEVELMIVVINAVVLMGDGVVQGAVFKPQAMALPAVHYGRVAGGNEAVGFAGRAALISNSGHNFLSLDTCDDYWSDSVR